MRRWGKTNPQRWCRWKMEAEEWAARAESGGRWGKGGTMGYGSNLSASLHLSQQRGSQTKCLLEGDTGDNEVQWAMGVRNAPGRIWQTNISSVCCVSGSLLSMGHRPPKQCGTVLGHANTTPFFCCCCFLKTKTTLNFPPFFVHLMCNHEHCLHAVRCAIFTESKGA